MNFDELIKGYKQQTRAMYAPVAVQEVLKHDATNLVNQAQLLYADGGLFADCDLEAAVFNTVLTPYRSIANMIPVRPSNFQKSTWAFITDLGDVPVGAFPVNPCDPSPTPGDMTSCTMECEKGRISYQTKTMELDALIQRAHRGVQDDLFFLGSLRGVPNLLGITELQNSSIVAQGAVRRQMQLVGKLLQRDVIRQVWSGDPTDAALNTANGGRKEFWGLLNLIANDYVSGVKPGVNGTNCDRLNSDLKDFANACIGSGTALFPIIQELEDTLFNRAALMGYSNVDWRIVMHPVMWSELVKHLPCEILSDSCVAPTTAPAGGTLAPIHIVSNDMGQVALRQEMQRSMTLTINGRLYPVILDDGLPLASDGLTPPTYTGSIFFIPFAVDGEQTLFWEHADYSAFTQELAPIPGTRGDMLGWSDGGRLHSVVSMTKRCFEIDTKMELCLIFKAPQLAGRIDNIDVCPLQAKPFGQGFEPTVTP